MAIYKQSVAYTRTFFMVSSTDHLAAKTGAAPVVNIAKAGAAFGAAAGTVTEIANGWYKVALTTTDTNTTGDLSFHITGTGADDTDLLDQVVSYDPFDAAALGLSRLDAAITSRMATFTLPANFASLSIDASGRIDLGKWIGVAPAALTASGFVQAMLLRWLTDNAAGTPNALISGRVDANAQVVGDKSGYSLTQAFPANFSSLSIDASGRVDLGKWIGVAPAALTASGYVQSILLRWLTDNAAGTPSALVQGMVQSAAVVRSAATQAGSAAGTIVLDASASATNDFYKDCFVWDVTTNQIRLITGYTGATKTATVGPNWQSTPGTGDTFIVMPAGAVDLALWLGSAPGALISGNVPANIQATGVGVIDSTALNASAVTKIHQYAIEGAMTEEQLLRIVLAATAGKSNSHQLGTPNYRDQADAKNRIAATTDANGNRTIVTVDGT